MRRWGGWLLLAALVAGAVPTWAANGDQKYKSNTMGQFLLIDAAAAPTDGQWVDLSSYGYAWIECVFTGAGPTTFVVNSSNSTSQPANSLNAPSGGQAYLSGIAFAAFATTVSQYWDCGPNSGNNGANQGIPGNAICPHWVKARATALVGTGTCTLTARRIGNI